MLIIFGGLPGSGKQVRSSACLPFGGTATCWELLAARHSRVHDIKRPDFNGTIATVGVLGIGSA